MKNCVYCSKPITEGVSFTQHSHDVCYLRQASLKTLHNLQKAFQVGNYAWNMVNTELSLRGQKITSGDS